MSLAVSVIWGGAWNPGERLTPTLLNAIFQGASFNINGTISAATKPAGGIDSTWLGSTFFTGQAAATPASGDIISFWDISTGSFRRATVGDLLGLGFAAPAAVTSVTPADEAVVLVSGVQKRVTVRLLGVAAVANIFADGTAATAADLASTDKVLVTQGGSQVVATVERLTGGIWSGRATLASGDLDLVNDFILAYDASAGVTKKLPAGAVATGLVGFVQFDGRSSGLTTVPGQNVVTSAGSDTVALAAGHGIPTGEVRQGWWTGSIPMVSTPTMVTDTPYWIRATSGNEIAFYLTKASALADTGRIDLASDNGSSGWTFRFWQADPTANSGGTIGIAGVVILNPTDAAGTCGQYRIFLKSAAALTHPVVIGNARDYEASTGVATASVQGSTSTTADIWVQGPSGGFDFREANPLNVMIQA